MPQITDPNAAWILSHPKSLVLSSVDLEAFRAEKHFVEVEPLAVGICGSDIKEYLGARHGRSIFGHEVFGRVTKSSGVDGVRPGDWVVHNPNVEINRSSGFARRFCCSAPSGEILARALIPVPESAQPAILTFVEPLAVAFHCVRVVTDVPADGKVLIAGSGFFGILIGLVLQTLGHDVILANRSLPRLEFARNVGFFDPKRIVSFDQLDADYEMVIIATAKIDADLLDAGMRWVKSQGVLHVFAGTGPNELFTKCGVDIDNIRRSQLQMPIVHEGRAFTISGSHGCGSEDFADAIEFIGSADNLNRLSKLVSGFVAFEDLSNFMANAARDAPLGRFIMIHDQEMVQ
jgi:threonine dehydrogenase-like Zn-dependent dehydrogenase